MSRLAPLIIPALSEHTATMIFLHGRGDTGFGWKDTFEGVLRLPYMKVILPHAPTRKLARCGGASMPAWYDSKSLTWDGGEIVEHVEGSRKVVFDLINNEISDGIAPDRILLGGFSQGAAVSLFSGLTYHRKLGGVAALSGYLLQHSRFPGECQANKKTPVFFGCGDSDSIVPFGNLMKRSFDYIDSFQEGVEFHVYRNLDHSVSNQELDDVKDFIERNVPRV
ncbi:unnamed protein product [Bursaphelenchus xylophilus]|uniref:palmitoyl-protein hydrolase n=1 Tax=Bursaphelenchus xylophilus TaxID=6326 RepID=A0A1I7S7E5_BURXY|nr:unnamed protein product [Bursaphelenchus xylophilus]CAG9084995.1 unnamed protein product [Bursaphelenchus xylophilus]